MRPPRAVGGALRPPGATAAVPAVSGAAQARTSAPRTSPAGGDAVVPGRCHVGPHRLGARSCAETGCEVPMADRSGIAGPERVAGRQKLLAVLLAMAMFVLVVDTS